MNGSDFYLICFGVGFLLSMLGVLAGAVHFPHLHLHLHHAPHAGAHGGKGGASPFNFATLAAFLIWFGGAGYLLTRFHHGWFLWALALAVLSGLSAAAVVFWFLVRVLMKGDRCLDPADYEMTGVLGKVTAPVREGGTGEMIFSQEGRRRGVPVRSDTGKPLAKGVEVVVTRYEKGVAYVREWDELEGSEMAGR